MCRAALLTFMIRITDFGVSHGTQTAVSESQYIPHLTSVVDRRKQRLAASHPRISGQKERVLLSVRFNVE